MCCGVQKPRVDDFPRLQDWAEINDYLFFRTFLHNDCVKYLKKKEKKLIDYFSYWWDSFIFQSVNILIFAGNYIREILKPTAQFIVVLLASFHRLFKDVDFCS